MAYCDQILPKHLIVKEFYYLYNNGDNNEELPADLLRKTSEPCFLHSIKVLTQQFTIF